MIGGIRETQEMLDRPAAHAIVSDVEVIPIQQINEAYARLLKSDVKYRFVIDAASLRSVETIPAMRSTPIASTCERFRAVQVAWPRSGLPRTAGHLTHPAACANPPVQRVALPVFTPSVTCFRREACLAVHTRCADHTPRFALFTVAYVTA
ncbi:MAG TPA: hypothetical protein VFT22_15845 [Kofleriaceae bacterium]|nr:hypothetical protein [Kofleriaceae bacterium]